MAEVPSRQSRTPDRLAPQDGVLWAVDDDAVVVMDANRQREIKLRAVDAVLWDLLLRSASTEAVLPMFAAVAGIELPEARQYIYEKVRHWCETALLGEADNHG